MARIASFCLFASVALLVALGIVMLASTGVWSNQNTEVFHQQVKALALAVPCAFALIFVNPDLFRRFWKPIFIVGCVLLALCYVPGVAVKVDGASRWLKFPGLPQFQASEIGKITTIIAVAAWFASRLAEIKSFVTGFILPGVLLSIPTLLIMFEKDVDTAMCLGLIGFVILFCVGVRLRYLLPVLAIGVLGVIFLVQQDTVRKNRIEAWKILVFQKADYHYENDQQKKDIADLNRQQKNALIAFTNGGVSGLGLGESEVKHGALPASHTDFIFPVVGEELGLWATLGVVLLYLTFAVSGITIAMRSNQMFSRLLALGLTMLIVVPAFLNIAVVTVSVPNAGLPLPFISYGGTSLICSICTVAMIYSIHRHTTEYATEDEYAIPDKLTDMKL